MANYTTEQRHILLLETIANICKQDPADSRGGFDFFYKNASDIGRFYGISIANPRREITTIANVLRKDAVTDENFDAVAKEFGIERSSHKLQKQASLNSGRVIGNYFDQETQIRIFIKDITTRFDISDRQNLTPDEKAILEYFNRIRQRAMELGCIKILLKVQKWIHRGL